MRAAELCAGYGGLALAIEEVFGAETAWVSEFEAAPSKILAHHWPNTPNHGDMTKIEWAAVEPVDIISGGTPCQDLSAAGARRGMTEGTRSNLWVQMREAVATIRPTYVIWENVRGAYSAEASSDLEHCPGCMGASSDRGTVLRALGRVLGDLSDLGYDCQWRGLRAADVGAPHGRFRVFVLATKNANVSVGGERRESAPGQAQGGRAWANAGGRSGTPAALSGGATFGQFPRRALIEEAGQNRRDGSSDHCGERVARNWGASTPDSHGDGGERRGANRNLAGAAGTGEADRRERERDGDATHDRGATNSRVSEASANAFRGGCDGRAREAGREEGRRTAAKRSSEADSETVEWGEYEPAIRRWEQALGRRAPAPTEPTGRNGGNRLSARFAEWMMGVPDGWIVDVPGITRNEALKAAGNGVVPQQAIAALSDMLANQKELEEAA